jgi:hypothetical protein
MALTLLILLAMLVPAAAAAPEAPQAPEWVHGVELTYPTEQGVVPPSALTAAFVNPNGPACPGNPYTEKEGDTCFRARYNLSIVGTQVDDVLVRFRAIDQNGSAVVWEYEYIVASNDLQTGVNQMVSDRIYPTWDKGWYRFQVCAIDMESPFVPYPGREWFCETQDYAVYVDWEAPGARLIKPVNGAWLNGTELLVGKAWDPAATFVPFPGPGWVSAEDDPLLQYGLPVLPNGGIKEAWFDYCAITNWQPPVPPAPNVPGMCGPNDDSWIRIETATPTPGVPYQYDAMWDTTAVPDDWSYLRFCAKDFVNLESCSVTPWIPWTSNAVNVFTNNRYYVDLRPGWNLVSTPLMLYDDNMCNAMLHIQDKVNQIYWDYDPSVSNTSWKMWTPADCPSTATFEHGKGYWINMKAPARLSFIGSWKNVGNQAPPEYGVLTGWNLIGYTPWGQPTFFPDRLVADYLQGPVASAMQALWRYDAASGVYIPLYAATPMVKGYGYWLAVARAGVIRP